MRSKGYGRVGTDLFEKVPATRKIHGMLTLI